MNKGWLISQFRIPNQNIRKIVFSSDDVVPLSDRLMYDYMHIIQHVLRTVVICDEDLHSGEELG